MHPLFLARKGEKYRLLYKKIEEEEERRQRWRWLRGHARDLWGWVKLLLFLALLGAGIYFGVPYGLRLFRQAGEKIQNLERPADRQQQK